MSVKRALKFLGAAAVIVVTPAAYVFLSSLWIVEVTAVSERRNDALTLLAEDAWFLRNRRVQVENLDPNQAQRLGETPVFGVVDPGLPPRPSLPARFPSCWEPEVVDDPARLRQYRATGYPFNIRTRQIIDASNLLMAKKLGSVRMAMLNTCLAATPFADSCGDWLDDQSVSDGEVISFLEEHNFLERSGEKLCWPQAELSDASSVD